MATMIEVKCKNCNKTFMARVADRNRGWAQCCSKSCAATINNQKTGNWQRYCSLVTNAMNGGDKYEESTFSNAHLFDNTEL